MFAHGGDAGQVHGCVKPEDGAAGRPNVIIVGPNDTCPGGYNTTDWAAQGPAGPAGETGPPPAAMSPDPPSFSELAKQAGFTLKSTKTTVVKKTSSTPAGLGPYSRFARSPIARPHTRSASPVATKPRESTPPPGSS